MSDPDDFFTGDLLAPPRARATDPAPSHDAAARSRQFAGSHEDLILQGLAEGPATAHELEPLIGLTVVQIDRRIAEMRRKGLVRAATAAGEILSRGTPTGGWATVWEVAE